MNWEKVKLGDHINILSGFAFDSKFFNESEGAPLVRIRDVGKNSSETYYNGMFDPKYVLSNGDLLVSMDGEFRIAEWNGGNALLNQRVCKIIPKNNSLDKDFLKYLMPFELKQIEQRTSFVTVKHLSVKDINAIEIPLPSLSTQKQIVKILEKADDLRKKDLLIMTQYDELLPSIFHDLFGSPIKNEKGWEKKSLGLLIEKKEDLVDGPFGSSVNTKLDYIDKGEIPVVRTKNVSNFLFVERDLKFMTREKYETIKRSQVLPDDIILTKVGTIGNVCFFPMHLKEGVLSTTGSCRIRPNEKIVNKQFLAFTLYLLRDFLNAMASEGVQPFLNMSHIKSIPIILPSITLQNKFASIFLNIQDQQQQIKQQINQSEALFQTLLQKAFKGELIK